MKKAETVRICPYCGAKTNNNKLYNCPECNKIFPKFGIVRTKEEMIKNEIEKRKLNPEEKPFVRLSFL